VYTRAEMETYINEHAYLLFLDYEVFADKQKLPTPRAPDQ